MPEDASVNLARRERLRRFPILGLLGGALFALWAAFVNAISQGAALGRSGLTLGQVAAVYLLAGVAGGTLVALGWPHGRISLFRAALLGALGLAPMYALFALALGQGEPWREQVAFVVVVAALVGGAVGIKLWLDDHPRGQVAPWIDALRYPTRHVVLRVWLGAGAVATLAWFIGGRWAGTWPALLAGLLFAAPLALAALVTLVALRPAPQRPPPGAA
jgi:hypothetical protein